MGAAGQWFVAVAPDRAECVEWQQNKIPPMADRRNGVQPDILHICVGMLR